LVSVLHDAMQQLQSWYGQDTSQWHWGNLHQANFSHPLANSFPLNLLFQIPTMERPGNTVTINIGGDDNFAADPPSYQQDTISSMREIIDLAHYDTSLWILPTGQSGQPFSSHYHDLTPLWNEQHYQKMSFSILKEKNTFQQELILVRGVSHA
jgi:penicillin amidase